MGDGMKIENHQEGGRIEQDVFYDFTDIPNQGENPMSLDNVYENMDSGDSSIPEKMITNATKLSDTTLPKNDPFLKEDPAIITGALIEAAKRGFNDTLKLNTATIIETIGKQSLQGYLTAEGIPCTTEAYTTLNKEKQEKQRTLEGFKNLKTEKGHWKDTITKDEEFLTAIKDTINFWKQKGKTGYDEYITKHENDQKLYNLIASLRGNPEDNQINKDKIPDYGEWMELCTHKADGLATKYYTDQQMHDEWINKNQIELTQIDEGEMTKLEEAIAGINTRLMIGLNIKDFFNNSKSA